MTTGAGSLNAGVPVEVPGVANDVVIEGVESGAGFEATAVGAMVGVVAVGVMPGAGMESAGAIGGGVAETGEPPAVTVGPGFVAVGSGALVKEGGVAGGLAGAPAGAVFPPLAGAALPPPTARGPTAGGRVGVPGGGAGTGSCVRRRALAGVPRGRAGACPGWCRPWPCSRRPCFARRHRWLGWCRLEAGWVSVSRPRPPCSRCPRAAPRRRNPRAAPAAPRSAGPRPAEHPVARLAGRRPEARLADRPRVHPADYPGRGLRPAVLLATGAALLRSARLGATLRRGRPGGGRGVLAGATEIGRQEAADRVG